MATANDFAGTGGCFIFIFISCHLRKVRRFKHPLGLYAIVLICNPRAPENSLERKWSIHVNSLRFAFKSKFWEFLRHLFSHINPCECYNWHCTMDGSIWRLTRQRSRGDAGSIWCVEDSIWGLGKTQESHLYRLVSHLLPLCNQLSWFGSLHLCFQILACSPFVCTMVRWKQNSGAASCWMHQRPLPNLDWPLQMESGWKSKDWIEVDWPWQAQRHSFDDRQKMREAET